MIVIEKLKKLNLQTPIAIIGAGSTGKSCFDLLNSADIKCSVFDESQELPDIFSDASDSVFLGEFNSKTFSNFGTILLSPGVDTRRDCFLKNNDKILTDIELFARIASSPIVGITGSNGKSTVVSLIHDATVKAGKDYILCGNIGLPVLKALLDSDDSCDGYIVELSSYHLERCPSLKLSIGVWLNVSPDHLDRYDSYNDYIKTKANILDCSKVIIANKDDEKVNHYANKYPNVIWFSFLSKDTDYFVNNKHIVSSNYLNNNLPIFAIKDFPHIGGHYIYNLMAAFAVIDQLRIPISVAKEAYKNFIPLASRFVFVGEKNGVTFINDSKATNVGATSAAISGILKPIVLIAGGQGKCQDFSGLALAGKNKIKASFLIGEDARYLRDSLIKISDCKLVKNLKEAVRCAIDVASSGDVIILSPACASFDMFSSYLERGRIFEDIVMEYINE